MAVEQSVEQSVEKYRQYIQQLLLARVKRTAQSPAILSLAFLKYFELILSGYRVLERILK